MSSGKSLASFRLSINHGPERFAHLTRARWAANPQDPAGEDGMRRLFRKFWNDDRGNVLLIFGACLPLLVGAAGIATDTIEWTLWKRQLQRAADSGAIAGVYTRINTNTEDAVTAAVNADLAMNNHVGIAL